MKGRRALVVGLLLVTACLWPRPIETPEVEMDASTPFDELWDYGDPEGTEEAFRALLPAADGWSVDQRLQLSTQLARTRSLRGEFAAAHSILDEVERELSEETPIARVRYELERGRTWRSAGELEPAAEVFAAAFERADELGLGAYAADALHMLALVEPDAWTTRAIEYCEASADPAARRWLGPMYHNGWMDRLERGELEEALGWAEKSRDFRASVGDVDGERIGRWSVFHTLRAMGRFEEALAGQLELLADYGPGGDPSGFADEEIAECLLALGRGGEARAYYRSAWEKLRDVGWLREEEPARLERLERLGRD